MNHELNKLMAEQLMDFEKRNLLIPRIGQTQMYWCVKDQSKDSHECAVCPVDQWKPTEDSHFDQTFMCVDKFQEKYPDCEFNLITGRGQEPTCSLYFTQNGLNKSIHQDGKTKALAICMAIKEALSE